MITVRLGTADPALPAPQVQDGRVLEAGGIILSGVLSASGIVLYALGHTRPAAALGAAGVLVGSVTAAARILG